ncbi:MAG: acyl-CoA thioesterase [Moorella sp. (in: firmicutes)]|jgi:acyl-CoA thioesterase|uniref:hydroxyphenylacetyl-CoA thioesterase PaaI n=1 Tax=unclassified Neomoorella TaxID=2676739 RepID=UPI0010FFB5A0|nr:MULTISPECIES: hydroxyphenylacetyl-CoA thioesterase PaaI [unclassified Moorella (in: firmicutes)]MDK2817594.1 acyl-CoA thioesterase [Moorella sp. (in: firmicutes)]GEA14932.1 phenylacetic acid degradation protein PaaD [Moorella sp. E308F]GEA17640.1 phenylacetic acid degradation protein PaaD [Moorella sp. E306M]
MDFLQAVKERYTSDTFPRSLGIELLELAPGYARVAMTITENMLNFHGIGHGGAIFTLADTALGLASNSHGNPAVAISVTINYLAPARAGTRLVAEAREEHLTRRTGVYRITVNSSQGEAIAVVHGTVYRKDKNRGP